MNALTRRDFLQALLPGTGAALLQMPVPFRVFASSLSECSGSGDYDLSRGNTDAIIEGLEKNRFSSLPEDLVDTGEAFDLVVIGGGVSRLSAAYHFTKKNQEQEDVPDPGRASSSQRASSSSQL